ncbi:DUF4258 domain-containing protein [Candidatus Woesearchaeota archaeon]|nr:DUF4258 domain-containing protein [Candidatus Woesearchaeota archaeon]
MERRGITREEVVYSLNYPDIIIKKHGKYFFRKDLGRGTIEVVARKWERFLYILTIYWL